VKLSRSLLPHSKAAVFSLCGSVLACLAFTVAPDVALAGSEPPEPPGTVEPAEVKSTTAVLQGVVNPLKASTVSWFFEYNAGAVCTGGSTTLVEGPAEVVDQPVAVGVEGLTASTKYTVCLVAENEAKEATAGAPVTFETATPPQTPETSSPAKSITARSAVLEGTLNPGKEAEVGWHFLYSTEPTCAAGGLETSPEPVTKLKAKTKEHVTVTELQPNKTYTFCLVATNQAGESVQSSNEVTVKTEPAPPEIVTESESASPVTPDEEALGAQVNANNQETTYTFEYSTTESAGELTGTVTKLNGAVTQEPFGAQPVTVNAPGLVQNTTYYYRVIAENAAGEKATAGKVEHFTTLLETPETLPATLVTSSAATLNGVLSPNATAQGEAGTYEFAYRESPNECQGEDGKTAPAPATVAPGGKEAVSVALAGLPPDTTYTYCLLERSAADATAIGAAVTFTTRGAGISEEYVSKVEATAAILHAQIDPNESSTSYHFEYDRSPYTSSAPHGTSVPIPSGEIPAGTSPVPVYVQLSSLAQGTTYYYRVVAVSKLSPTELETFDGPDKTFATPAEPSTAAESCPNARARTEQPYGQALPDCRAYELVSPLNKNGRGAEAVDSRASVSGGAVAYVSRGSFSEAGQPVPQGAAELSRYVARRGAGGWSTQNITPPSVALTAPRVAFAELLFTPDLSTGLLTDEFVPLVADEPAGYVNLYVAGLASNPASYQTVSNVTPPGAPPYTQTLESSRSAAEPLPVGVSTDLSHVFFQQAANLTANAEGLNRVHVYDWTAGKLSLVDVPPAGTKFEYGDTAGAPGNFDLPEDGDTWHAVSANGLRVFFTVGESGHGAENEGQLYVRENPEQPQSLEENGKCTEPTKACTIEVSRSQKTNGTGLEGTDPNGPQPAYYRDANAEGTRVFFTSKAELTNNANTGDPEGCKESEEFPNGDCAANLYEYNLETKELTDLTVNAEPSGATVLGLVNAGENAGEENSYVYFVANGVLANNENANKEKAQPGDCKHEHEQRNLTGEHTCSLYVVHYGSGKWETKFVATLLGGDKGGLGVVGDEPDWVGFEGGTLDDDLGPGSHTVRVTPDGTTLAFESVRSLTGYDDDPVEPGAGAESHKCTERGGQLKESDPAVPCREVFLYDAVTGKLVCASCDPSGARPVGPAELGGNEFEEGDELLAPSVYYLPHNLSENGGRLFFQSPDALVSHDSNSQLDVYEWEQLASPDEVVKGENSCTSSSSTFSASDGGCVFPISDVAGDFESRFMDASPSGNDVFLATKDQLVPEADADSRANVYDVRVGGGFPVTIAPPVCNNGDSCKAPVSPQPGVFGAPASATFSGPGNPTPAVAPPPPKKATTKAVKCKRGYVKKKVKKKQECVKSKSKKAKKAKRAGNDRRTK